VKPIEIPIGCLEVVMPVYNEDLTIHLIVERVLARPEVGELVTVNDCSKDGTLANSITRCGQPAWPPETRRKCVRGC
jgi:hypothetical protein